MELRGYQMKALQSTFDFLGNNPGKNPCVVIPTGGGKSVLIAAFIEACLEWYPGIHILMLTHQKELIEQDARALKSLDPKLDIGIYSASLKSKDLSQQVTFASIQSIYKKVLFDLKFILVDEAHLINNEAEGMYRRFIDANKNARVVGFTATPFRMNQGYLTDGEGIFDELIEPVSILELQRLGYLSRLRSKSTFSALDVTGVKTRGGEFIESDLQEHVDVYATNEAVCDEIVKSAAYYNRQHILIFCSGVKHAEHISEILKEKGMAASFVAGYMKADERDEELRSFTSGRIQALCNANLLTTGFDYPDIDMIAMLRPTLSPGLYLQMAGRGLRLKKNGGDCLILDFAGNVTRHGPVSFVEPPKAKGSGESKGVAPCKECPECLEIVPAQVRNCPVCGYEFPKHDYSWVLFDGDINGGGYERHKIWKWSWMITESKAKNPMIVCEFRANNGEIIKKFFMVWHEKIGRKAMKELIDIGTKAKAPIAEDWDMYIKNIEALGERPVMVITQRNEQDRRYRQIVKILWQEDIDEIIEESDRVREMRNERRERIVG